MLFQTGFQIEDEEGAFKKLEAVTIQCLGLKKFPWRSRDLYVAVMEWEKTRDEIDRTGMWQVLQSYWMGGLLEAAGSFYNSKPDFVIWVWIVL